MDVGRKEGCNCFWRNKATGKHFNGIGQARTFVLELKVFRPKPHLVPNMYLMNQATTHLPLLIEGTANDLELLIPVSWLQLKAFTVQYHLQRRKIKHTPQTCYQSLKRSPEHVPKLPEKRYTSFSQQNLTFSVRRRHTCLRHLWWTITEQRDKQNHLGTIHSEWSNLQKLAISKTEPSPRFSVIL